jgi:hypothetical protein
MVLVFMVFLSVPGWVSGEGEGDPAAGPGKGKRHPASPSIFIMDKGMKPQRQLIYFMIAHNGDLDTGYVARLVRTYIRESEREGVNYDVAICQMCLETGFLRFTGSVSRYQNNFCGLGAINAYTAGDWFGSMEEGVRAHIQHLKAYASVEPIKGEIADKRIHRVRRGTVFTIYDLTGKWAADPAYGTKISALLKKLYEK